MWWSKRFLPVLLLLALSACGFRPIYGRSSYNPDAAEDLAGVHINSVSDRQGQLVRNALIRRINPDGEPSTAPFRLEITMTQSESQQALRADDTATRNQVSYNLSYALYSGKTAVTSGQIFKMLSYDFLEQHYANVSAEEDISRRAAEELAEELRNRLSAYFTKANMAAAAAAKQQQQQH